MIEKFADYEGTGFISAEGQYVFEVMEAELKDSKSGNPMVQFTVKAPEGQSTLYFSLQPKARWKYNSFIKACLKLDSISKISNFELDYETIHNDLIGRKFIGNVKQDVYTKVTKKPLDDGTFEDVEEEKTSYKIEGFTWVD